MGDHSGERQIQGRTKRSRTAFRRRQIQRSLFSLHLGPCFAILPSRMEPNSTSEPPRWWVLVQRKDYRSNFEDVRHGDSVFASDGVDSCIVLHQQQQVAPNLYYNIFSRIYHCFGGLYVCFARRSFHCQRQLGGRSSRFRFELLG